MGAPFGLGRHGDFFCVGAPPRCAQGIASSRRLEPGPVALPTRLAHLSDQAPTTHPPGPAMCGIDVLHALNTPHSRFIRTQPIHRGLESAAEARVAADAASGHFVLELEELGNRRPGFRSLRQEPSAIMDLLIVLDKCREVIATRRTRDMRTAMEITCRASRRGNNHAHHVGGGEEVLPGDQVRRQFPGDLTLPGCSPSFPCPRAPGCGSGAGTAPGGR